MRSLKTFLLVLGTMAGPHLAWADDPPLQIPIAMTASKDSAACPATPLACANGDCNKEKGPILSVFGDALLWKVHNASVPFAQPFNGTGPLAAPQGPVAVANPRFEPGIRLGAGVAMGEHGWLVGTFTWFRDTANATTMAPAGSVLQGNLVFPNTVNGAFVPREADAHYDIRLWTGDIDYKCAVVDNDHLTLTWLAGARYAHLAQNLNANYAIFGTTTVNNHIGFDGAGPRAGLEGEYKICGGFYGYGKGVMNLLAGRFGANYAQGNTFVVQQAQTQVSEDRLVPVLEAEIGLGWKSSHGRVRVAAGYYVGSWFNTLTVPSMVQGVQANNFTTNGNNFRDNMTFDGLFARIEFRY